jgi:hypothetical protein
VTDEQKKEFYRLYDQVTAAGIVGIKSDAPIIKAYKNHKATVFRFDGSNPRVLLEAAIVDATTDQIGMPSGHELRKRIQEMWNYLCDEEIIVHDDNGDPVINEELFPSQTQETAGMATPKNQTELEAMKARDAQAQKDAKFTNVEIVNQGDQIVLPEGMSATKGIEWLKRREQEDEREVGINEPIEAYPLDGAHAFMVALKRKYGWQSLVPTP